jgi:hypothetical protein
MLGKQTSQLVAVKGTLEKIQPVCDGRSEARRIYLNTAEGKSVGLPAAAALSHTCRLLLSYLPRTRTTDSAYPYLGTAVSQLSIFSPVMCAILLWNIRGGLQTTDRLETMCS